MQGHVGGRLLLRSYDLYQKLQLQFYVLLMMGAMDTRNMWSNFAVNKYLHTVASRWILLIKSYDASNHEYKKKLRGLSPRANYTDRAAAAGRRS